MEAVGPFEFTHFIERVVEPYTGLSLLGISVFTPADDWTVQVWYDAELAVQFSPKLRDGSFVATAQLPLESDKRVRVVAVGEREIAIFDGRGELIGKRKATSVPVDSGIVAKLGGVVRRGMRSVATGEILSPRRWIARFDRLSGRVGDLRFRVQSKWLRARFRPRTPHDAYVERTAISAELKRQLVRRADGFRHRPTVSILMPVYNVSPVWFREAVASVVDQIYGNWELCIADDQSTKPELIAEYSKLPDDPRIKFVRRETNGHICSATNSAADLATGEYIALLDHDDRLAPEALLEVVAALQDQPNADLVYSDEDKIDGTGYRYDPQLKPDWSPELLLSYNYINHFTVIRRSLFESVGRYRIGYEGSQDHDLLLRVTEKTDRIVHVPRILYHWRAHAESTAGKATQKGIVHTSGRRAVDDALRRRGVGGSLGVPAFAQRLGLPILELDGDDDGPSVAVIIHGSDSAATVRAVKANTAYRNFTTYLVLDEESLAESLNRLAAARTEDVFVFVKAGIEPADTRWLSRIVAHLTIRGVAAVGGLMRSTDGSIHSAGTVLGQHDGTAPDHACQGVRPDAISYYFYAEVTRNVSAVASGCLATSRSTFETLGGFDAGRYGQTMFDVDYCMRIRLRGERCVHVGGAEFRTREAGPRTDDPLELLTFRRAFGRMADSYSNPQFDESRAFHPSGDPVPLLLSANRPALKIAVAAHNLNNPEGAPRYLSEIVLGLRERGSVEPAVWSPLGGAGEAVYARAGVPVTVADEPWSRRFVDGFWTRREYESALRELRKHLKSGRPDAVIANTLLTFPMVEAAACLGIPSVWIIHESYSSAVLERLFPPFVRDRIRDAFRLASRVVPASHDTAALFERFDVRGNFRVIHNGIPDGKTGGPARSKASRNRIVSIGTVCERKGQHTLIEAAAILARTRRDFAVDIVGLRETVPYAGFVRQLVERRQLAGVVNLVTETNDVENYFREAHVFVCTSHMETFSRSILEAESYGLPIVSTACQGIGEQVKWGFNALRFDAGDAAGLAVQLDRILSDDRLQSTMARRSRAAFENHLSVDEMLDRYDLVLRSAVGRYAWDTAATPVPLRRAA